MNAVRFAKRYLKHLTKAKNEHGLHSPFLFDFYNNVISKSDPKSIFKDIETIRAQLLLSNKSITYYDLGAGSNISKKRDRDIREITDSCSKSKKEAQLLHNLVHYFQFNNILEMGTSMGISTMYLSGANPAAKIISLEGVTELNDYAKNNFLEINLKNIQIIEGEFSESLPLAINQFDSLDFVFFDGNHQKKPTIDYFHTCLPHIKNDSIFVFDDIHWSEEMEEAWKEIYQHPKVTASLDLFFMGIIFFKKELSKEHFILKY